MQSQKQTPKSVANFTAQTVGDLKFSRHTHAPDYKKVCDVGMMSSELFRCIEFLKKFKTHLKEKRFIVLAFTSNAISSGLRQCIIDMMPWIKCIVTTTGAIEEDIIKTSWDFKICDYYNSWGSLQIEKSEGIAVEQDLKIENMISEKDKLSDSRDNFFRKINLKQNLILQGSILRNNGYNRIGNILVHNSCYVSFEQYLIKKLKEIEKEYITTAELCRVITPQKSLLEDIEKDREEFIEMCQSEEQENQDSLTKEEKNSKICEHNKQKDHNPLSEEEKIESKTKYQPGTPSFLRSAMQQDVPVFISAIGDGSIGDIFTFSSDNPNNKIKMKGVDGLADFKHFIGYANNSVGLSLGDGVITSKMRYVSNCITITTNDKSDGGQYYNDKRCKIIGDMSILLPLIMKEVFIEQ